jgi:hypothetical protein
MPLTEVESSYSAPEDFYQRPSILRAIDYKRRQRVTYSLHRLARFV